MPDAESRRNGVAIPAKLAALDITAITSAA